MFAEVFLIVSDSSNGPVILQRTATKLDVSDPLATHTWKQSQRRISRPMDATGPRKTPIARHPPALTSDTHHILDLGNLSSTQMLHLSIQERHPSTVRIVRVLEAIL